MKRILALALVALPVLAVAQTKPVGSWSDVELSIFARNYTLGLSSVSYDRFVGDRVSYSGIAVQLLRAPNRLQLLNPWAPNAYGPSEQNLVFDPITGRPAGLKFFTISF
jgi:hypothetical protein